MGFRHIFDLNSLSCLYIVFRYRPYFPVLLLFPPDIRKYWKWSKSVYPIRYCLILIIQLLDEGFNESLMKGQ